MKTRIVASVIISSHTYTYAYVENHELKTKQNNIFRHSTILIKFINEDNNKILGHILQKKNGECTLNMTREFLNSMDNFTTMYKMKKCYTYLIDGNYERLFTLINNSLT